MAEMHIDTQDEGRVPLAGAARSAGVLTPADWPAAPVVTLIRDLTTTRQSTLFPSGALWASISYDLLPGATAVANQFAKIVVNATSDADAAGRLAVDGAFIALCQGKSLQLSANGADPITRVDVVSAQAVGSEKTLFQIVAGVQQ